MNSNLLRALALAASALFLGACGTMSQFNGYISASPEAAKVVAEGGYSEEATAQIAIVCNPDFNGGKCSAKALKKIQEYSMSCQQQIDEQLAGAGQSGINGALPYGVGGAVGTGIGAKQAFGSTVSGAKYAIYGGVAYLFSGAVNGLITGSYAMASAKGTCTRDFWSDVSKSDPDFRGTHVVVAYAGKSSSSRPPTLDKSVTPLSQYGASASARAPTTEQLAVDKPVVAEKSAAATKTEAVKKPPPAKAKKAAAKSK